MSEDRIADPLNLTWVIPAQGDALLMCYRLYGSHGMQEKVQTQTGDRRTLGSFDLALIWFGAAISIMELWAGGLPQLTSIGIVAGILAILLGRLVGNGLMGAMAQIGGRTGLPSMVLAKAAFGWHGGKLPAVFNILQLIGWTGWMLFVGMLYLDTLAGLLGWPVAESKPVMSLVWVGLLAVLCVLWSAGGAKLWRRVQAISGVLLFLLTVWMTVVVLREYPVGGLFAASPLPDFPGVLRGMDIVIAMSVSWLPLVADYSRFAKGARSGWATFGGYFVGGVWMYAVGLLVAIAGQTDAPDQMVVEVLGSQGVVWALLAVGLVLLSTVTTTFLDIYSTVVSTQSLWPRLPERWGSIAVGVLAAVLALSLDVFAYAPFLEAIGLIFLPAFTVVILDYYLRGMQIPGDLGADSRPQGLSLTRWTALVAWLVGVVVYDWAGGFHSFGYFAGLFGSESFKGAISLPGWPTGSSLPCIVITAVVYWLLVKATSIKR